ncbi:MAG: YeeE/YedE family protein [Pirellulales bacterium]|nr:YeeE/YedE family protein [Pirellulales bacterium]
MLTKLHAKNRLQLLIGFLLGVAFGFLLQKGGVTYYDVIINQLLLKDFTVVKIMLTAMITGMIGVHLLVSLGLAELHPKSGALGTTVPGALIFGVGFGLLGYCPGTAVAAVGHGAADALLGGIVGMLVGAMTFATLFPKLKPILGKGDFGTATLPRLLKVHPWVVVIPVIVMVIALLYWIENAGF